MEPVLQLWGGSVGRTHFVHCPEPSHHGGRPRGGRPLSRGDVVRPLVRRNVPCLVVLVFDSDGLGVLVVGAGNLDTYWSMQ